MVDIGTIVAHGRDMGPAGAKILTAAATTGGIRSLVLDALDDLDEANTEGAFGVTLLVTRARIGKNTNVESDLGWGGKQVIPAGGADHLRSIIEDFATDIFNIEAAGSGFVITHTAAKISPEFLSGGRHIHRNPAFGNKAPGFDDGGIPTPGIGPDGTYDWIVQAFQAIALDIAAIKAADSLTFTPRTVPAT